MTLFVPNTNGSVLKRSMKFNDDVGKDIECNAAHGKIGSYWKDVNITSCGEDNVVKTTNHDDNQINYLKTRKHDDNHVGDNGNNNNSTGSSPNTLHNNTSDDGSIIDLNPKIDYKSINETFRTVMKRNKHQIRLFDEGFSQYYDHDEYNFAIARSISTISQDPRVSQSKEATQVSHFAESPISPGGSDEATTSATTMRNSSSPRATFTLTPTISSTPAPPTTHSKLSPILTNHCIDPHFFGQYVQYNFLFLFQTPPLPPRNETDFALLPSTVHILRRSDFEEEVRQMFVSVLPTPVLLNQQEKLLSFEGEKNEKSEKSEKSEKNETSEKNENDHQTQNEKNDHQEEKTLLQSSLTDLSTLIKSLPPSLPASGLDAISSLLSSTDERMSNLSDKKQRLVLLQRQLTRSVEFHDPNTSKTLPQRWLSPYPLQLPKVLDIISLSHQQYGYPEQGSGDCYGGTATSSMTFSDTNGAKITFLGTLSSFLQISFNKTTPFLSFSKEVYSTYPVRYISRSLYFLQQPGIPLVSKPNWAGLQTKTNQGVNDVNNIIANKGMLSLLLLDQHPTHTPPTSYSGLPYTFLSRTITPHDDITSSQPVGVRMDQVLGDLDGVWGSLWNSNVLDGITLPFLHPPTTPRSLSSSTVLFRIIDRLFPFNTQPCYPVLMSLVQIGSHNDGLKFTSNQTIEFLNQFFFRLVLSNPLKSTTTIDLLAYEDPSNMIGSSINGKYSVPVLATMGLGDFWVTAKLLTHGSDHHTLTLSPHQSRLFNSHAYNTSSNRITGDYKFVDNDGEEIMVTNYSRDCREGLGTQGKDLEQFIEVQDIKTKFLRDRSSKRLSSDPFTESLLYPLGPMKSKSSNVLMVPMGSWERVVMNLKIPLNSIVERPLYPLLHYTNHNKESVINQCLVMLESTLDNDNTVGSASFNPVSTYSNTITMSQQETTINSLYPINNINNNYWCDDHLRFPPLLGRIWSGYDSSSFFFNGSVLQELIFQLACGHKIPTLRMREYINGTTHNFIPNDYVDAKQSGGTHQSNRNGGKTDENSRNEGEVGENFPDPLNLFANQAAIGGIGYIGEVNISQLDEEEGDIDMNDVGSGDCNDRHGHNSHNNDCNRKGGDRKASILISNHLSIVGQMPDQTSCSDGNRFNERKYPLSLHPFNPNISTKWLNSIGNGYKILSLSRLMMRSGVSSVYSALTTTFYRKVDHRHGALFELGYGLQTLVNPYSLPYYKDFKLYGLDYNGLDNGVTGGHAVEEDKNNDPYHTNLFNTALPVTHSYSSWWNNKYNVWSYGVVDRLNATLSTNNSKSSLTDTADTDITNTLLPQPFNPLQSQHLLTQPLESVHSLSFLNVKFDSGDDHHGKNYGGVGDNINSNVDTSSCTNTNCFESLLLYKQSQPLLLFLKTYVNALEFFPSVQVIKQMNSAAHNGKKVEEREDENCEKNQKSQTSSKNMTLFDYTDIESFTQFSRSPNHYGLETASQLTFDQNASECDDDNDVFNKDANTNSLHNININNSSSSSTPSAPFGLQINQLLQPKPNTNSSGTDRSSLPDKSLMKLTYPPLNLPPLDFILSSIHDQFTFLMSTGTFWINFNTPWDSSWNQNEFILIPSLPTTNPTPHHTSSRQQSVQISRWGFKSTDVDLFKHLLDNHQKRILNSYHALSETLLFYHNKLINVLGLPSELVMAPNSLIPPPFPNRNQPQHYKIHLPAHITRFRRYPPSQTLPESMLRMIYGYFFQVPRLVHSSFGPNLIYSLFEIADAFITKHAHRLSATHCYYLAETSDPLEYAEGSVTSKDNFNYKGNPPGFTNPRKTTQSNSASSVGHNTAGAEAMMKIRSTTLPSVHQYRPRESYNHHIPILTTRDYAEYYIAFLLYQPFAFNDHCVFDGRLQVASLMMENDRAKEPFSVSSIVLPPPEPQSGELSVVDPNGTNNSVQNPFGANNTTQIPASVLLSYEITEADKMKQLAALVLQKKREKQERESEFDESTREMFEKKHSLDPQNDVLIATNYSFLFNLLNTNRYERFEYRSLFHNLTLDQFLVKLAQVQVQTSSYLKRVLNCCEQYELQKLDKITSNIMQATSHFTGMSCNPDVPDENLVNGLIERRIDVENVLIMKSLSSASPFPKSSSDGPTHSPHSISPFELSRLFSGAGVPSLPVRINHFPSIRECISVIDTYITDNAIKTQLFPQLGLFPQFSLPQKGLLWFTDMIYQPSLDDILPLLYGSITTKSELINPESWEHKVQRPVLAAGDKMALIEYHDVHIAAENIDGDNGSVMRRHEQDLKDLITQTITGKGSPNPPNSTTKSKNRNPDDDLWSFSPPPQCNNNNLFSNYPEDLQRKALLQSQMPNPSLFNTSLNGIPFATFHPTTSRAFSCTRIPIIIFNNDYDDMTVNNGEYHGDLSDNNDAIVLMDPIYSIEEEIKMRINTPNSLKSLLPPPNNLKTPSLDIPPPPPPIGLDFDVDIAIATLLPERPVVWENSSESSSLFPCPPPPSLLLDGNAPPPHLEHSNEAPPPPLTNGDISFQPLLTDRCDEDIPPPPPLDLDTNAPLPPPPVNLSLDYDGLLQQSDFDQTNTPFITYGHTFFIQSLLRRQHPALLKAIINFFGIDALLDYQNIHTVIPFVDEKKDYHRSTQNPLVHKEDHHGPTKGYHEGQEAQYVPNRITVFDVFEIARTFTYAPDIVLDFEKAAEQRYNNSL